MSKIINFGRKLMRELNNALKRCSLEVNADNRGVGIIEVILILVILIAVVLLFKNQIMDIIDRAFSSITNDSNSIIK